MPAAPSLILITLLCLFAISSVSSGVEKSIGKRVTTQVIRQSQSPTPFDFLKVPRDNAIIYGSNLRLFLRPKQFVTTSFVLVKGPPFSNQSNRQAVIEPHVLRRVVSPCLRSVCSARVTVRSNKFLRYTLVLEAHRKITGVRGFYSIYNLKSRLFKIKRIDKKVFVIVIPFQARYLEERREEIREL